MMLVEYVSKVNRWARKEASNHGEKGKVSAMEEICDLVEKSEDFGERDFSSLSQEMKEKVETLLMLM